jgi:hypothetical protein
VSDINEQDIVSVDSYGKAWVQLEHPDIEGVIQVTADAYTEVYKDQGWTLCSPERREELRPTEETTKGVLPEGDTPNDEDDPDE